MDKGAWVIVTEWTKVRDLVNEIAKMLNLPSVSLICLQQIRGFLNYIDEPMNGLSHT